MTTYNTWGTSWGTSWALSWTRSDSTPNIPTGGAGHPTIYWGVKKHKKFTKNLDWLLDKVVSDLYGELADIPAVQKEAAKIVRPYAQDGLKVPQMVNWEKFGQDFDRLIMLYELYQKSQDDDSEDEWILMH